MASPVRVLLNPERRGQRAENLHRELRAHIIGQDAALEKVVDAYQMLLAGLNAQQRPIANFLFLGPTGTGKTRVVEALAEALFHTDRAVIKVDCGEFQHSHEIAKLLGSPPGYLGHRETHPVLTQEALNQYHTPELPLSLVLFDEIEKASDSLWQLLLGILDKATLTLGDNRRVSFCQAMIFMTSNIGATEMQRLLQPGFGFVPPAQTGLTDKLHVTATEAARRKFSPEFFNRLDHVVVFEPLERRQLDAVLDLELDMVRTRLARTLGDAAESRISLRCSEEARDFLLAEGTDLKYGARHLKRAIERHIVQPLASLLATGQLLTNDSLIVEMGEGKLVFTRDRSGSARSGREAWRREAA
jgi:ATP-dependent Clp protease ATP-binding subunit ClpB